ncbi:MULTISPECIES: MATE family efflux transporter [Listeria]|uniref:MATE family efflux transporter n=1 Tax=Listeria TaxID=1637 RepID=UPI000B590ACF|nr:MULTISPECIES: MATE family efflux transporter [Listeria]
MHHKALSPTRKILNLAIPATIENLLQTMMGFVDGLMVARIGLLAVTAVGLANTILAVYLAIFLALGIGTASLIARYLGDKKVTAAKEIVSQSTFIAILVGALFSVLTLLFASPLLQLMGAKDSVLVYAVPFLSIVGGSSVFISLMTVWGSVLRAAGDTKTPMKISFVINILNVLLNYILIFGIGFIPAFGVVGSAIGTVIARLIGCLLLYMKIQQTDFHLSFRKLFRKSNYSALIRLSIPAALERLVMRLGQVLYFSLIVAVGIKTYAAHSIAGTIESFTYMPGYGFAIAATTLVGMSVGAKNYQEAKQLGFLSAKIGLIIMSAFGAVLFFFAPVFGSWFTQDPEALHKIIIALRIDAFIQPILAISLILTGALQGLGDTKSPLYSTVIGMWGVRIIGVIIFSLWLQMDIAGIWLSIGLDLLLRSIYLTYRFRKKIAQKSTLFAKKQELKDV